MKSSGVGHVVLVSGGADSATVLAMANELYQEELKSGIDSHLVTFHCNYGQRTELRELTSYNRICDHYSIKAEDRYIIDIGYLTRIGGSCLTDKKISVPKDAEALKKKIVPVSYVPCRNLNLLAIASSIAAVKGSSNIWIGVVEQDSSGYPDCRGEFIDNANHAINCGLPDGHDVVIDAPLLTMKKSDIIAAGIKLQVPYHMTWSCYEDNFTACGECDSCRLRILSFEKNGICDPINYNRPWNEIVDFVKGFKE